MTLWKFGLLGRIFITKVANAPEGKRLATTSGGRMIRRPRFGSPASRGLQRD